MKKKLLKILIYGSIFSMLLSLCSGFASAVDPVSAATMANALAQAITAYGASQGVSMTFDVASTDGIGEGVHELWNDFKEDIQDNNVPTYDSLAVTMWADIYTKVGNNIGININDTEMPYIDAFWNWLLSGPAQMTKVDNQYYEWTVNQAGNVEPIPILTVSDFSGQPIPYSSSSNSYSVIQNGKNVWNNSSYRFFVASSDSSHPLYAFAYDGQYIVYCSDTSIRYYYQAANLNNDNPVGSSNSFTLNSSSNGVYYYPQGSPYSINGTLYVPEFSSLNDGLSAVASVLGGTYPSDNLSVQPYIGDTSPQNVYIPDNDDVNYAPLPYIGGLDINWDDTLFGDGTGTLTDAQKQEIAGTIDDDITNSLEKSLTLAADDPEPAPPANEVYIPFLPLQLPSFNFSLSGIWHYVVTWVGTLGTWFTAMFNMWSCLPYAMVVPVYATLVVVIVLGVYRRFLS